MPKTSPPLRPARRSSARLLCFALARGGRPSAKFLFDPPCEPRRHLILPPPATSRSCRRALPPLLRVLLLPAVFSLLLSLNSLCRSLCCFSSGNRNLLGLASSSSSTIAGVPRRREPAPRPSDYLNPPRPLVPALASRPCFHLRRRRLHRAATSRSLVPRPLALTAPLAPGPAASKTQLLPDPACPASSPPAGPKPMVSSAQPLSCACWASKFRPVVFFFCCGDFRIYPGDYRFAEKPLNFMHIITHKWCIGLK